jgi:hypothetical protein
MERGSTAGQLRRRVSEAITPTQTEAERIVILEHLKAVFDRMQSNGIYPDKYSYTALLTAQGRVLSLEAMRATIETMKAQNLSGVGPHIPLDTYVWTTLLTVHARLNDWNGVLTMYATMNDHRTMAAAAHARTTPATATGVTRPTATGKAGLTDIVAWRVLMTAIVNKLVSLQRTYTPTAPASNTTVTGAPRTTTTATAATPTPTATSVPPPATASASPSPPPSSSSSSSSSSSTHPTLTESGLLKPNPITWPAAETTAAAFAGLTLAQRELLTTLADTLERADEISKQWRSVKFRNARHMSPELVADCEAVLSHTISLDLALAEAFSPDATAKPNARDAAAANATVPLAASLKAGTENLKELLRLFQFHSSSKPTKRTSKSN